MALSIARGPSLESETGLGSITLAGFLREVTTAHAAREAMTFRGGGGEPVRFTYREMWEQSLRVARSLIAIGVGKDTRVGVLATNRPEWVFAMFGIALTGGTCVALSSFATVNELEQQLRLADVSVLFFERSVASHDFSADLLSLCPELAASAVGELQSSRLPYLRRVIQIDGVPDVPGIASWPSFLDLASGTPEQLVNAIAAEISPADLAMVFFSSGTTGKPKGIMQTHRAAAIQCWRAARILALEGNVRTWSANGMFWSGNFAMGMGATFAAGGSLVLQRFFAPGEALQLMAVEKVTYPLAWPHQWARLAADPSYLTVDLSSLRFVGENSPLRKHPTVQTSWDEPWSAYGNSETLTLSAVHASGTPQHIREGNHGFPLPGNTMRIIDPLTGSILPLGETGEIAVKGPTLMLGYLKTPLEVTFDEDGFFRTGDGGFIDETGRLHWHGRLNDIIKTGGANVSPVEIDGVLAEYPGVKVAKTVGVPHETLGEMVVACVVAHAGAELQESSLREFVGGRLSSYKVPRRVLFLLESDLSFTGTNKVKLDSLRELAVAKLRQ